MHSPILLDEQERAQLIQKITEAITPSRALKWVSKNPLKTTALGGTGAIIAGESLRRKSASKVKRTQQRDIPQYVQQAGVGRGIKGAGKLALAGAIGTSALKSMRKSKAATIANLVGGASALGIGASGAKDVAHAIKTKVKFRSNKEQVDKRKRYEYAQQLRRTLK